MFSMLRAKRSTVSPARVSVTPVDVRLKSFVPNFFSMLVIFWESPGRDMYSLSAA